MWDERLQLHNVFARMPDHPAAWRAVEVSALALDRGNLAWEATPPAGMDPPPAGMSGFGSGALAVAGASNLKMPRVHRISGAELDVVLSGLV